MFFLLHTVSSNKNHKLYFLYSKKVNKISQTEEQTWILFMSKIHPFYRSMQTARTCCPMPAIHSPPWVTSASLFWSKILRLLPTKPPTDYYNSFNHRTSLTYCPCRSGGHQYIPPKNDNSSAWTGHKMLHNLIHHFFFIQQLIRIMMMMNILGRSGLDSCCALYFLFACFPGINQAWEV